MSQQGDTTNGQEGRAAIERNAAEAVRIAVEALEQGTRRYSGVITPNLGVLAAAIFHELQALPPAGAPSGETPPA